MRHLALVCRGCLCLGLLILAGCDGRETPIEAPFTTLDTELRQSLARWGAIPVGSVPPQDPARVELGRNLFFDPILSGNRDVSCATCHHPETALGDRLPLSIGTGGTGLGPDRTLGTGRELVPRTAPSLLNSGLGPFYMLWDGRLSGFGAGVQLEAQPLLPGGISDILVAQALLPVLDRREMRGEAGDTGVFGEPNELAGFADDEHVAIWDALMRRLLAIPEYAAMFEAAFPTVPATALRFEHAARALAAFQVEAFTKTDSPFDRYLQGDHAALTMEEKRGAILFFGAARCAECHSGPLLGGRSFANIGVPQIGPGGRRQPPLDLGRGEHLDARFYRFAFRVPPLRNVELTSPYMHSGAYATLDAVVRHYDDVPAALRGYDASQLPPRFRDLHHGDDQTVEAVLSTLDGRLLQPLDLSEDEMAAIVAFLKSLTDPSAWDLASLTPAAVPSGLPVPR